VVTKKHILVVEDEENILELIRFNLSREGFQTTCTVSGEEAIKIARAKTPDLALLDLMLPDMDGLEICRILKNDKATAHIPIIMVTAKGEETDIVTGLELGADDYITKPFSPRVLVTRIKAVFRKKSPPQPRDEKVIRAGDIAIHPGRHEVLVKNQPVELTFTEFRILHLLAARPGWVFTRDQIVEAVRGEDYAVTDRAVDFQIVGLRKKLGACAKLIKTVRGVGYKFSG
jgi:two-component system phosphate regulon response regulator PhoB